MTLIDLGIKLKEARILNKKTQKQLGNNIGVGESTLRMWELGKNKPSPESLRRLSENLDLSYSDLMFMAGYITERERLVKDDGSLTDHAKRMAQMAEQLNESSLDKKDILINPERFPDPVVITKSIKVPSQYKINGKTRNFVNSDILDLYYLIEMSKGHNELLNLKYKGKPLTNEDKQKIISIIETLLK